MRFNIVVIENEIAFKNACKKYNIPTNVSIENVLPYADWECGWYNEVGNRYLVA